MLYITSIASLGIGKLKAVVRAQDKVSNSSIEVSTLVAAENFHHRILELNARIR